MTVTDALFGPFAEFAFMRRALAGSLALAFGAAPIGVFLSLRRMSLMADGIAHAILPGTALGFILGGISFGALTAGALGAGFAVVLAAGLVSRFTGHAEDSALAAFYLVSIALGVVLLSATGGAVDILGLLFGSVLGLDDNTLIFLAVVSTITMAALALLYRAFVAESVDPNFLARAGRLGTVVHLAFLALAVLNLVAGFHALGTLLAVGIMILPAAAARFWADTLAGLIAGAVTIAFFSAAAGLLVSFHAGTPAGPSITLVAGSFYLVALLFGRRGGLLHPLFPKTHLEA